MNENEFGFRFKPGDTVYHTGDDDRAYKFIILWCGLHLDNEGVNREYGCRMLTGSAGLLHTADPAVVKLQEWELTK